MTPGCDSREDNELRRSGDTIVVQDFASSGMRTGMLGGVDSRNA